MIILRVTTDIDENYCYSLINEIKKYEGSCDEVWLPTLYGYPKIETHKKHAEKLKRCAEIFRNAGIKVSTTGSVITEVGNTLISNLGSEGIDVEGLLHSQQGNILSFITRCS